MKEDKYIKKDLLRSLALSVLLIGVIVLIYYFKYGR